MCILVALEEPVARREQGLLQLMKNSLVPVDEDVLMILAGILGEVKIFRVV